MTDGLTRVTCTYLPTQKKKGLGYNMSFNIHLLRDT